MKRSAVALSAPTVGQLALGELAINTTDGKLFLKKSVNGVESIVDVTKSPDAPYTINSLSVTATRPPFTIANQFNLLDVADGTDGLTGFQGWHKVMELGTSGMRHQIAFTDDRILRYRASGGTQNWTSWSQIWDSSSLTNLSQLTNGPGYTTNLGTVTAVAGTGAINSTGGTTPVISIAAATTALPGTMSSSDKTKLDAITGSNTGDQANITGNAGTATKLATARNINGVPFDGSANISLPAITFVSNAYSIMPFDYSATVASPFGVPYAGYYGTTYTYTPSNTSSGLSDGGTGISVLHVNTSYVQSSHHSHELGFTDNDNLWIRGSASDTTWGAWTQIWDTSSLTNLNQLTNGPGYTTNLGTVTSVTGTGAISATAGAAPVISIAAASVTVPGTMSAADKVKINAVSGTNTGDETAATIKTKLGITTLSGSNTGDQTSVSGNAGSATSLETARAINGVSFDGTADITISAVDSTARQATSGKDTSGGYTGLTLLKINFKNVLNTFTSFCTNSNTAARTYTFPDKSGTIATTSGDSISVVDHAVTGMLLVSTVVAAQNATVALPVTSISGGIITTAPAAAIILTVPTGTAMCAEMGALSIVGQGISWSIINTSASFGATLAVGTSHTLVGDKVIAPGVSARFTTVESGVNTCVTYRIA